MKNNRLATMKCQKCRKIPIKKYPLKANIKDKNNEYLQLVYFDLTEYNEKFENILLEILKYTVNKEDEFAENFDKGLREAEIKYGPELIDKVIFYDQLRNTLGDIKLACAKCAGWK